MDSRVWTLRSKLLEMLLDFRKAKKKNLAARVFFTLFSSLATFSVFGSQYPNTGIHSVFLK